MILQLWKSGDLHRVSPDNYRSDLIYYTIVSEQSQDTYIILLNMAFRQSHDVVHAVPVNFSSGRR